jgi:hypothetical protein
LLVWSDTLLLKILPICYIFKGLTSNFFRRNEIFVFNFLRGVLCFDGFDQCTVDGILGRVSVVYCDAAFLWEQRQGLWSLQTFFALYSLWFCYLRFRRVFVIYINGCWMAVEFADSLQVRLVKFYLLQNLIGTLLIFCLNSFFKSLMCVNKCSPRVRNLLVARLIARRLAGVLGVAV